MLGKWVLPDHASTIGNLLDPMKAGCGYRVATLLRNLRRQHNHESGPVLDVSHLGFTLGHRREEDRFGGVPVS